MEEKRLWLKRMLWGGFCGVAVTLGLILLLNFVLKSISILVLDSTPDYGNIQLTFDRCAAYFGSAALAVAVELLSVFVLGAAIGLATLPFADRGKRLALLSLAHFIVTGVLAQGVGWAYQWFGFAPGDGPWLVLVLYAALYALIWGVRWVVWYAELRRLRRALHLK